MSAPLAGRINIQNHSPRNRGSICCFHTSFRDRTRPVPILAPVPILVGPSGSVQTQAPPPADKLETAKNARPETLRRPLQIIISIADQRVSLFDNGALIARSSVSTGTQGHPTPLGVFSVISKQRWHRSNIYSAAPMPYMQRITWSGIALHAGVVPGYPASHGCIRLKNDFAIRLWHLTKRGTRVIIAHDDVQPVEITNPHLFEPNAVAGSPEFQTGTVAANEHYYSSSNAGITGVKSRDSGSQVSRLQARLPLSRTSKDRPDLRLRQP